MDQVEVNARELTSTDAPNVPGEFIDLRDPEANSEYFVGVDKAATPAERVHSEPARTPIASIRGSYIAIQANAFFLESESIR